LNAIAIALKIQENKGRGGFAFADDASSHLDKLTLLESFFLRKFLLEGCNRHTRLEIRLSLVYLVAGERSLEALNSDMAEAAV
jgi:hypothetical protein